MISFKTQRILEKIKDKEFIDVSDIMIIADADPYLPKNRADCFSALKILATQKFIKKVQRGLYKVDNVAIKKELGALK